MSNTPIEILVAYFNKNGWPLDVDEGKLRRRYSIEQDKDEHQKSIIKVERHRPIMGTSYTKGMKMSAFETYYMRYVVDCQTGSVNEISEIQVESNIDVKAIVDDEMNDAVGNISVEPLHDGLYLIRDNVSNEERTITSQEEAVAFADTIAEPYIDFFIEHRLTDIRTTQISEEKIDQLTFEYSIAIKSGLQELAKEAWKTRDY